MPLNLTANPSEVQDLNPAKLTFNEKVYQKMPELPADDFAQLVEDIRNFGVKVPVEVTEKGVVLDGHNRVKAAREAGVETVPAIVKSFDSDEDAVAHIFAVNLQRRHMNRTDKAKLVKSYLLLDPYKSNRQIAEELGVVSDKTVGAVREEAEAAGEVTATDTRKGKDGKTRSSSARTSKPKASKTSAERKLKEQRSITASSVKKMVGEIVRITNKLGDTGAADMVGVLSSAQRAAFTASLTAALPIFETLAAELGIEGYEYGEAEASTEEAPF